AFTRHARPARRAERRQRVVVNLAARHHGNLFVEQVDEAAQDAALGLSTKAKQNEVVLRENRVDQLRHDRLVVADDPGEQRLAGLQLAYEVVADFLFDGTRVQTRLPEFAQRMNGGHTPIL